MGLSLILSIRWCFVSQQLTLMGCTPSAFGPGMMGFRPPSHTQCHPSSRPLMTMILWFMASLQRSSPAKALISEAVCYKVLPRCLSETLDDIFTSSYLPRILEKMTGEMGAEQRRQMYIIPLWHASCRERVGWWASPLTKWLFVPI